MGNLPTPSDLLVNNRYDSTRNHNQHKMSVDIKGDTNKGRTEKMATACVREDTGSTEENEHLDALLYLDSMANDLQKAVTDLALQCPGLETIPGIQEYLDRLMNDIDGKLKGMNRYTSQEVRQYYNGLNDSNELRWIEESVEKVEQGQKFVRDCLRCAQFASGSVTSSGASSMMETDSGRGSPLWHPKGDQISLVHSLSRIRERLEMLEKTPSPVQRCYISLYKRDKLDEAHGDDHILIANAGSNALQQKADAIHDAKQFFAVYGQNQETPVAAKFIEVYRRLYGLTPEEGRGSLSKYSRLRAC